MSGGEVMILIFAAVVIMLLGMWGIHWAANRTAENLRPWRERRLRRADAMFRLRVEANQAWRFLDERWSPEDTITLLQKKHNIALRLGTVLKELDEIDAEEMLAKMEVDRQQRERRRTRFRIGG